MNKVLKRFYLGRFISFIGSAFSEFAIPIFLFQSTKSAFHTGMQWVAIALVRILVTLMLAKIPHGKSNKKTIAIIDLVLGINVIVFLILSQQSIIFASYLFSIINAGAVVIQNGYIDSLIGQLVDEHGAERSSLNAFIQNSQYVGTTVGYSLALMISQVLSLPFAIFVDAITFFICSYVVINLPILDISKPFSQVSASFGLLFKSKELTLLTLSQMFLGCAVFMYNSSSIVTIQRDFNMSPSYVVALKIAELVTYSLASYIAIKAGRIKLNLHLVQRVALVFVFIGFALTDTVFQFIVVNASLSFLIGTFQPSILGVFQEYALPEERRNFGTARLASVAIAGSIGAFIGSNLMENYNHKTVFSVASTPAIFSALLFTFYLRKRNLNEKVISVQP